jgi:transcriptional regulator with XRE-family HTH domain
MTVDEVIARNVRRVREARGLSVGQLADRLSVGRHLVYDYERPRPGAEQRQFLWSDLVKLCGALQITVFELVLPPTGEEVDMLGPAVTELFPIAAEVTGQDARSRLGWMLFGVDGNNLNATNLEKLVRLRKQSHDKMVDGINDVLDEFVDRANRMMEGNK